MRTDRTGRPNAGRAFTLIELLVVIAIIAVLAGLLLPALARAKSSARQVECISRMKQWALGFHSYVDENEGMIPREGYHADGQVYWNNWAQVQDKRSQDVWYNAVAPHVGVPSAGSYAPPISRLSFYERNSLFHCPSAKFPKAAGSPAYQIALFSVAMNSQLIEPPHVPTTTYSRLVPRASETVLFLDNLLDDEAHVVPQQAWAFLGQPSAMASRFAGRRHGRGGNLAFADGHVDWMPGTEVVETQGQNAGWARLPQTKIVWDLDVP